MKLSFSINGWHGYSWDDFCSMAKDYGFAGIELHDVNRDLGEGGAAWPASPSKITRQLIDLDLKIACIDCVADLADNGRSQLTIAEIERCIVLANKLGIPYVRVHASENGGEEHVYTALDTVISTARRARVVILMETYGMYSDTTRLRDLLNRYACDELAALWDMQHPYRAHNEDPETTITNLGAYVRHVHLKDSAVADGELEPRLVGEGDLPIAKMLDALRSVNYDGFISLEWNPESSDMDIADIVFPHFVSYMGRFDDLSKSASTLYWNKAKTGRYVWRRETIIDYTFPQLLDRMVDEFPDQDCIKYTTLDYTRTYSEFRDDVDRFARV